MLPENPSLQSPPNHIPPLLPPQPPGLLLNQSMNNTVFSSYCAPGGVEGCPGGRISSLQRIRCLRVNGVCCPLSQGSWGSTSGKSRTPLQGFYAKGSIPVPSPCRMVKALASPHCSPRPPTCALLPTGSVQKSSHKSQIRVRAGALEEIGRAPFPQPCPPSTRLVPQCGRRAQQPSLPGV